MKAYKLEVWVTAICFIVVSVVGGFLSVIFVLANEVFFNQLPVPAALVDFYPSFFELKESMTIMGFPAHYFLLIVLSWLGATLIGAIWCLAMDKVEEKQRA